MNPSQEGFFMSEKKLRLPEFITFTGLDDRTDLVRAEELAKQYPIEYGVLFSSSNKDSRYPSQQGVKEILKMDCKKSAHLCGSVSTAFRKGIFYGEGSQFDVPLHGFDRVQINCRSSELIPEVSHSFKFARSVLDIIPIYQSRSEYFPAGNLALPLFDMSGGRGKLPAEIPPLLADHLVGYAGGMGPDTVADYLAKIASATYANELGSRSEQTEHDYKFWIDMEGQIRTDGWFDLDKVQKVCELVYEK